MFHDKFSCIAAVRWNSVFSEQHVDQSAIPFPAKLIRNKKQIRRGFERNGLRSWLVRVQLGWSRANRKDVNDEIVWSVRVQRQPLFCRCCTTAAWNSHHLRWHVTSDFCDVSRRARKATCEHVPRNGLICTVAYPACASLSVLLPSGNFYREVRCEQRTEISSPLPFRSPPVFLSYGIFSVMPDIVIKINDDYASSVGVSWRNRAPRWNLSVILQISEELENLKNNPADRKLSLIIRDLHERNGSIVVVFPLGICDIERFEWRHSKYPDTSGWRYKIICLPIYSK